MELLPAKLAPAQVRVRDWSSQTTVPCANLIASPLQGAFSVCAQFRSAGRPSLPTPAPPAVHRAVLARVAGQQAAEAGFAQPMPGAVASADGSILVTCAFVGGRRVAFPREIIVEGFPLRLAAAGHAVGIDTSLTPATDTEKGSVAFAMCPADGGQCFVQLAPVTSCALRVTEALPGLQRCAAPAGCTNRVVGDDLDGLECQCPAGGTRPKHCADALALFAACFHESSGPSEGLNLNRLGQRSDVPTLTLNTFGLI